MSFGFFAQQAVANQANDPGVWSPANIETSLWLDAADSSTLTLSGIAVDEWRDKSGNGRHGSASGDSRPNVNSSNLFPRAISFVPSQFMNLAAPVPTTADQFHIVVLRRAFIGTAQFTLSGPSGGSDTFAWFTDNQIYVTMGAVNTDRKRTVSSDVSTGNFLISGQRESGVLTLRKESSLVPISASAFGASEDYIKVGVSGTAYSNGEFAEIIHLGYSPTTDVRERLEGYLAHKWGLAGSLPPEHPFKGSPP